MANSNRGRITYRLPDIT